MTPRSPLRLSAPRSLRWRLTLAYVVLIAGLLLLLGAYQHLTLRHALETARVDALAGDVEAARQLTLRGARRPVDRTAALCQSSSGTDHGHTAATTFAASVAALSGHTAVVALYDPAGNLIAHAPETAEVPPLSAEGVARAATGQRSAPERSDSAAGTQLVVGLPVVIRSHVCAVAELSVPTQPLDDVLEKERRQYAISAVVTLAVALGVGLLLTGGVLRPLARLTSSARLLAAGDLTTRSNLRPRRDEVGVLANAFDEMAARIEHAFQVQSESEDRTRRFVADASHELRTPLTALKGYLDVLRRGAGRDPATLDTTLETMSREAERMRLLVLDLLALARLDARPSSARVAVDLNDVVAHVLDEPMSPSPGPTERRFSDPPAVALADRDALCTIVRNLRTNACRYAVGAAQTYTTVRKDGFAVLQVHDDGPGIRAADVPHIFERFYRSEKTRTRDEGGSGLGLAIVQALARAADGEVTVTSREGEGTTFTVTLPAAPDDGALPANPSNAPAGE